jgi:hypothetical protein
VYRCTEEVQLHSVTGLVLKHKCSGLMQRFMGIDVIQGSRVL